MRLNYHRLRRQSVLSPAVYLFLALLVSSVFGQQSAVKEPLPTRSTEGGPEVSSAGITVSFDPATPGIVIVESNGRRIKVDTVRQTVEELSAKTETTAAAPDNESITPKSNQKGEGAFDFDRGEEPYANRLINLPTPRSVPKGTWNLEFTHRFTQPVHPIEDSAPALFGLDSFGVASFGLTYGITDRIYVSAYRSPLCQRGLCRTVELGIGYNILTHDVDHPFALSLNGSIEGNDNFTEEYTYNLQARLSGRLGKRLYLFFSPALHLNSNGQRRFNPRPSDFFPPAAIADSLDLGTHTASFGFGAAVLIRPDIVATFEFTPRTGFKLGRVTPIFSPTFRVIGFDTASQPEIGFGIQKNIGKHSFALTFSNTQTTTTSRYNSSNLVLSPRRLILGFNLTRRF